MQKPFYLLAPMLALPGLYPLSGLPLPAALGILLATSALLYALVGNPRATLPGFTTAWPTSLLIAALALASACNCQSIPTFLPSAWNTLLAPLHHTGLLPLLTPLTLAFTVWVMRTTNHPWLQINKFTLALFTCLLMWPDGAADLPTLGLLILSLTLLLTRQRIHWAELAACILLLATAATARSIFLYVPFLMSFALFAVWPKRALAVALGSAVLLFAFHPALPTLPTINLNSPSTLTAVILLTIVTIQSLYHWRWWPAPQHAAWGLGAPALIIALSNLSETASLTAWYGAIYLAPALPVITYTLLRPNFKN